VPPWTSHHRCQTRTARLIEAASVFIPAATRQLAGHFLIDTQGIIRWVHVESENRITDFSRFPSDEELLAAAASLQR
jgi:hypothetical protein